MQKETGDVMHQVFIISDSKVDSLCKPGQIFILTMQKTNLITSNEIKMLDNV